MCDSADLDVKFNIAKSVAMRTDPRYNAVCANLALFGGIVLVQCVHSLKYFAYV